MVYFPKKLTKRYAVFLCCSLISTTLPEILIYFAVATYMCIFRFIYLFLWLRGGSVCFGTTYTLLDMFWAPEKVNKITRNDALTKQQEHHQYPQKKTTEYI